MHSPTSNGQDPAEPSINQLPSQVHVAFMH